MLPILSRFKIANPTIFGSMNDEDLRSLFVGYGTYHFYQVLVKDVKSNPDHLRVLEQWFQCYWPWEMSFAKKRYPCSPLSPGHPGRACNSSNAHSPKH